MRRAHGIGGGVAITAALLLQAACSTTSTESHDDSEAAEGRGAGAPDQADAELAQPSPTFEDYGTNPETETAEDDKSTFALDVDTGSYAITRNYLNQSMLPPSEAVRTEELVNYFPHDYDRPDDGLGIHLDGTSVPFLDDPSRRVLRVGLQAEVVEDRDRRPATLTFVIDASGSMDDGKLEMVQKSLGRLVDSLQPDDEIAIVTYSNDAELQLEATPVAKEDAIRGAIDDLRPDAATNTEAGLQHGYEEAMANQREGGINRVVLLSDGVANEGETDPDVLASEIVQPAGDGIQLVTVGVGMEVYNRFTVSP